MLCKWIDESYRAVAPVTLLKELDGPAAPTATKKTPARPAKKAARKR